MNGVHDMGGMHGFGPIVREVNEPIFHAAWEARVRAMTTDASGAGATSISTRSAMASSGWSRRTTCGRRTTSAGWPRSS